MALSTLFLAFACLLPSSRLHAESLWQDDIARPMFADKRAVHIGDILTVIVQENNSASKKKNTKTEKSSGMDASIATFFYSPAASGALTKGGQMPALKYSSENAFNGGGTINSSEAIVARFGVRVIDVLPNRNLVIEGTRESAFSGEQQTIVLRGVVRPDDITPGNSVYSYNIADATIRFVSKGTLTDSERKGWFNKIWDKVTPF
ncbi:MAG: flagellar basal body L-ring protein FlgH [Verrucomicrobia bacterium]|nr:flagellar basal body L-ring protein FlgH [Verrucomicrobiota bacterium]